MYFFLCSIEFIVLIFAFSAIIIATYFKYGLTQLSGQCVFQTPVVSILRKIHLPQLRYMDISGLGPDNTILKE